VEDCCGLLDALAVSIRRLEAEIREEAKSDRQVEALRCIYGVGLITSMMLTADIGDISRFPTAHKLCA
jgi:transposase